MGKPFSFKLEKVLDYRAQLEEQAKGELAKAQRAHDTQLKAVDELGLRLQEHLANEVDARKSVNDMWLWRQYKEALQQDIVREKGTLQLLELKLQQSRLNAVERSKDRKLLDKLKETQARKYHEEASAKEEKENDEMAALRHKSQDF
ncbi:flagellar export protein FliJ [Pseudodesulfovibrio sp.]|uniref:flagellar export protein FliJ n=1 Tax=unclassified Pseudodesulfovibrio TaxID=2661612 RepID=UPI003B003B6C